MTNKSISNNVLSDIVQNCEYFGCDPVQALNIDPSSLIDYKPDKNPIGIFLAPTGMIPVKPWQKGRVCTPFIPIDCQEIVDTVISCYELGIGGVHLHARELDGRPTQEPRSFVKIIESIHAHCPDIIIGVTTSGRNDPSFDGRSRVLEIPYIDVASITVSSIQFPKSTVVAEEDTIIRLLEKMEQFDIKPEFEFFDTGGINIVKRFQRKHYCPSGAIYCNIFIGNIASTQANIVDTTRMMEVLPFGSYCGVAGFGAFQLKANTIGMLMGGNAHVRTGLEDNIYYDRSRTVLATNEDLVKRIVKIAELFERPIATPDQMRKMIGLKHSASDEKIANHSVNDFSMEENSMSTKI